jgi:hypothetical protein
VKRYRSNPTLSAMRLIYVPPASIASYSSASRSKPFGPMSLR